MLWTCVWRGARGSGGIVPPPLGFARMRTASTMLSRSDPAVRTIVRSWRRLTTDPRNRRAGPGETTLVACSGGADSCALVLALATATDRLVIAHVVHDLRPREDALADRDVARDLAERLGLPFVESEVSVRGKGANAESAAREARYDALAALARDRGVRFIATAHHADDQVETVLMSLLRGTGGAGIRGMPARRHVGRAGGGLYLIRPMLAEGSGGVEGGAAITHETCRRLCREAGIVWNEDVTNQDTSRLRAAIRHRVAPILKEIRPDVATRISAAAHQANDIAVLLKREARAVLRVAQPDEAGAHSWPRSELCAFSPAVLGELIRLERQRLRGRDGADRLSASAIRSVIRAIRDRSTDPRTFAAGGVRIRVSTQRVSIDAVSPPK